MSTLLENTLTQQNLGGCYNLYWAVLSTANRSKVHIEYCVCACVGVMHDFIPYNYVSLYIFLEYIQTIMMMEESVQHVVMTAIQEVDDQAFETSVKQYLMRISCWV